MLYDWIQICSWIYYMINIMNHEEIIYNYYLLLQNLCFATKPELGYPHFWPDKHGKYDDKHGLIMDNFYVQTKFHRKPCDNICIATLKANPLEGFQWGNGLHCWGGINLFGGWMKSLVPKIIFISALLCIEFWPVALWVSNFLLKHVETTWKMDEKLCA